jgi:hypothetical protein
MIVGVILCIHRNHSKLKYYWNNLKELQHCCKFLESPSIIIIWSHKNRIAALLF